VEAATVTLTVSQCQVSIIIVINYYSKETELLRTILNIPVLTRNYNKTMVVDSKTTNAMFPLEKCTVSCSDFDI